MDSVADWALRIRQEAADLHEEKIKLETDIELARKPVLRSARLEKNARSIALNERKQVIAKHVAEIAHLTAGGKVVVYDEGLDLSIEWS